MALIAYLMEFKQNYGPHLIIVPNAVLVNWKVGNQLLLIVCAFLVSLCAYSFYISRVSFSIGFHLRPAFSMLVERIKDRSYFRR